MLIQLIIVLISVAMYLVLGHFFAAKTVFVPWSGPRETDAYNKLAARYNSDLGPLINSKYSLMKNSLDDCPYYYLLPIFSYSFI